jgi:hypothetical protein
VAPGAATLDSVASPTVPIFVPAFRVYQLAPNGKILSGEWIEADDPEGAEAKASALCGPGVATVELWRGGEQMAALSCLMLEQPKSNS